ncbi:type II secretion system ATPase GspE [Hyphococcus sp.]|uniref:type II secretion system ATPase GspE n=1 Tax=Hyphococcus sp. TaxID=2038636 RepID=UPI00208A80E9|nr:MAG: type II secretion system protein GspE [Marinicaulis sp.]
MSEVTATATTRLAYAFAKERGLIVLDAEARPVLLGARGKAPDPWALIEARRAVGAPVAVDLLPPDAFERRLSEIYSVEGISTADLDLAGDEADLASLAEGLPKTADLLDSENDAPIIRLINALIAEAVKVKASDIHIEPYEKALSVRLRIDGVLREVLSLPAKMTPVLTSRVKVMARLDIAERRVPQDGRITIALGGKSVDVRVSTLPARFGERVVMRILDKDEARLDLDGLGMPPDILSRFRHVLARPNGIILVTGPTGSGKTTTLYGALTILNEPSRNILTVEDPVEYALDGVGQTQINPKVGMTFATGLRAILRQDPDIVMVGEVRDVETAEIAVQASLTGHLVLSTVHTNSAAGAITRLRDMGVEAFLLSSTVAAVLAQRLVRRLCPTCKEPYAADASTLRLLELAPGERATLYKAVGCGRCNQTGYEGRIGVYELIVVDEKLKRLIHDGANEQDIAGHAFHHAMTLTQSGFRHALAGATSIEEVLRVVRQEDDDAGL